MKILTISGSSRSDSSNLKFLRSLKLLFPKLSFEHYPISQLPLFQSENDKHPWPAEILSWRSTVKESNAVIISTPEYIHNIPAVLKIALEWLTSSGELSNKRVLPITFTPHPPRGEKAMQSLIWSLQALNASIVTQLPLYQSEISFDDEGRIIDHEINTILEEAMRLLLS